MSEISAKQVKKLRDETSAPIMEVRRALEEAGGDEEKAKRIIKDKGLEKVAKRSKREIEQGLIGTYVHADGKIGAMVHLACETDFVARTDEFKKLAREIAMQVAAMNPKDADELAGQEYIRDPEKKIGDLVSEVAAKTGENIQVLRISRFALGE
jgi:elongation factor Ts